MQMETSRPGTHARAGTGVFPPPGARPTPARLHTTVVGKRRSFLRLNLAWFSPCTSGIPTLVALIQLFVDFLFWSPCFVLAVHGVEVKEAPAQMSQGLTTSFFLIKAG